MEYETSFVIRSNVPGSTLDAGVDGVAGDSLFFRFSRKRRTRPSFPVSTRRTPSDVDRCQTIVAFALRSRSSPRRRCVDARHHVAVEHDERVVDALRGVAIAPPCRARRLDDVAHAHAGARASPNLLRCGAAGKWAEDHLVNFGTCLSRSSDSGERRSKIGTTGFGVWIVSGRRRVPLPPARRMAFMTNFHLTRPRRRMSEGHEPAEHAHGGPNLPGAPACVGTPHEVRRPARHDPVELVAGGIFGIASLTDC